MQSNSLPYLTTLTPLRGIAAVLMVVYHSQIMLFQFLPPGYTHFLDNCWLWVDFFFVLSGFIMCYAYSKYFGDGVKKEAYKKYIGSRFARIYPLHFITTLWAFIVVLFIVHYASSLDPFLAQIFNPGALPVNLLLLHSMHIYFGPPLNTPSWSLSTEWWAYLLFPFVVPYFSRFKTTGKMFTALLIIGLYLVCRYVLGPLTYFKPGPTLNIMADFGFIRCLAGFFTGMLLFTLYQHRAGYQVIKRDWFFVLSMTGLVAAMHFGVMDVVIVGFFPFVLLSAAYNQTTVKRFLDTRPLQRLGDWSFAIYMVHMPLIFMSFAFSIHKNTALFASFFKYVTTRPDYPFGVAACIVLLTLTLTIAALMYRFVEIPARNYFNRIFKTRHKVMTEASLEV